MPVSWIGWHGNSKATPPAAVMPSRTRLASSRWWRLQGDRSGAGLGDADDRLARLQLGPGEAVIEVALEIERGHARIVGVVEPQARAELFRRAPFLSAIRRSSLVGPSWRIQPALLDRDEPVASGKSTVLMHGVFPHGAHGSGRFDGWFDSDAEPPTQCVCGTHEARNAHAPHRARLLAHRRGERLRGAGPRHRTRAAGQGHHQSRHRPARLPDAAAHGRGRDQGAAGRPSRLYAGDRHPAAAGGGGAPTSTGASASRCRPKA